MPLTVRTNGSLSPNIITASWFNDFLNLLTGAMQDQEVTIQNLVMLKAIGAAPTAACSGTLAAGTTLGIGQYIYVYTYANADGETLASPTFSITTTSGNQKVNLTGITVGPTGTTARKVYRTAVGGGVNLKLLTTIADNVTTTFADTVADGSLGAAPPVHPSFGGSLLLKDATPALQAQLFSDGAALFNGPLLVGGTVHTVNGNTAGTMTWVESMQGTGLKVVYMFFNGFRNAGANQTFALEVPFTVGAFAWIGNVVNPTTAVASGFNFTNGGVAQNANLYNGGNVAPVTGGTIKAMNLAEIFNPFDSVVILGTANWTGNATGIVVLVGR